MAEQWSVRRGVLADAPVIAEINVIAWQDAYRGIVPDPVLDRMNPENRVTGWRGLLDRGDPDAVYVAVGAADRPVAYCLVGDVRTAEDRHAELPTGELMAIYADPKQRGTGAGHATHEAGLAHLAAHGYRYAVLWVFEDNVATRGFYESHGWRADGAKQHIELGGVALPEVRYGRFLTGGPLVSAPSST